MKAVIAHHDSSTVMCSHVYSSRYKQNYKWRSAELKSRWEVVAQTRHAVIAKLLVIDLAYYSVINKGGNESSMEYFCALRKHSGTYRTVRVVKLLGG